MENYYSKVGRLLSRREALKALSAASAAMLAGWLPRQSGAGQPMGAPVQAISAANKGTLASCIVRPQVTEGPYYVNEDLNRSDT